MSFILDLLEIWKSSAIIVFNVGVSFIFLMILLLTFSYLFYLIGNFLCNNNMYTEKKYVKDNSISKYVEDTTKNKEDRTINDIIENKLTIDNLQNKVIIDNSQNINTFISINLFDEDLKNKSF